MKPSRRWLLSTLWCGLLVVVHPVAAADPQHHHPPGGKEASSQGYRRLPVNEPAPGFALTDHEGRPTDLATLKGQTVVMTFFYSHCPDVCPVLLQTLESVEDMLSPAERSKTIFVGITVDPARDTPERLKTFLKERGIVSERWRLLSGPLAELARVAAEYGVVVRPGPGGDFVHNSVFVIIDGRGRETAEFHGLATPPEALVAELRAALKGGSQ